MLPEAFAIVSGASARIAVAESLEAGGPILDRCRALAERAQVDLILGGFPEACDTSRSYNTLVHLAADGSIRHRYRKLHLFDVQLGDGTVLAESRSTAAGEAIAVADLPCGPTGLTICYDMRFPGALPGAGRRRRGSARRALGLHRHDRTPTGICCCARAPWNASAGCWRPRRSVTTAAVAVPTAMPWPSTPGAK